MQRICIFCGSQVGTNGLYRQAATALGQLLVRHGYGLVYGGGHVGLMGVIADAVLASGGEVIGVIPESMVARELAHTGLTQLQVVPRYACPQSPYGRARGCVHCSPGWLWDL